MKKLVKLTSLIQVDVIPWIPCLMVEPADLMASTLTGIGVETILPRPTLAKEQHNW